MSSEPVQFHDTHGANIKLLNNKTSAVRYQSFCEAICFSYRPIAINEKVYCKVKFMETKPNMSWQGALRFGFTSIDPASLSSDLPRFAMPDMTNKPGTWAKGMEKQDCDSNILLHFGVNEAGEVLYGVNREEKGVFLCGVNTSDPLWAILDIYGATIEVEFSHA